ncbi:MAG: hypothetical protein E5X38_16035 [Mesorhizobium sp.]|uniref:hypothetical protein n=1 Tax=Mesorhizobium sp. TaxID=1871066 RepID=UPI001200E7AA|nr:hypothetical protein [Mesorhizobium sp.]TIQ86458.1 MAG: hypothetical protein E5X38_16035 [Mesorhizobium sp.]
MANMVNIANIEQSERPLGRGRDIRFVVMLTEQEDREIQAYRFDRQIETKAEALRTLMRKGLEAETKTATSELAGSN